MLAAVVGFAGGVVVGWFRLLHFTVAPLLWTLYSTPKVALAPLLILALGLGEASKIALVFLLALFPILLNTMEGVQTVSSSLIRAARVYGFRGLSMGTRIVLPATFPFILSGCSVVWRSGSRARSWASSSAAPAGWVTCSSARRSTSAWTTRWRSSW